MGTRIRLRTVLAVLVLVLQALQALQARAENAPTPQEEQAALRLADPGLAIELVASEPDVLSPVAMAWDEFGCLYVVEMTDYPTATTGGRIKRLEDRDGDGRFERVTIFAEALPFPSGVLAWNGGILVTAAPDLLFFKDDDGDGKAEIRKVILTGFGEGNQQLRVNSPTWGLDNWVYLANGRSGGAIRRPGDPAAQAVPIPRNDLRLKPDTGEFAPVAGFSQFGLPRDDWGDRFPSWNTVPLRHVVLEERRPSRSTPNSSQGEARTVAEILDLSDGGRVYSLAPSQRRFNAETVAFFNATCGPIIFRGDRLGASYRGRALVCEPLGSVVHQRRLEAAGPTFVGRRVEPMDEFLASTHPWFRPVNLANGPDGALYVADFCRAWVEHPAFVPEPLRASVDFREGHERGRIWRIVAREAGRNHTPCRPGKTDSAGLVEMLADPNGWCRDTAQRLLVERRDKSVVERLRALSADRASRSPLGQVHALWTLEGLGSLDLDTLRDAMKAEDPHVREQGARLAGRRAGELVPELVAMSGDVAVRVRLRVAEALAGVDTDSAREALASLAAVEGDSPWVGQAILDGVVENPSRFLGTLVNRQPGWLGAPTVVQARFLTRISALIAGRGNSRVTEDLLDRVAKAPGQVAALAMLYGAIQGDGRLKTGRLDWSGPAAKKLDPVLAAADPVVSDPARTSWVRVLALDVLLAIRPTLARPRVALALEPDQPLELQAAAAAGVSRVADPALVTSLFDNWDHYALSTRRILIGGFATTPNLAGRLLDAVEQGQVVSVEVDPATRDAMRLLADRPLRDRVDAVLRSTADPDRLEVIRRYQVALGLVGDVGRGQAAFEKNCRSCHTRNGQGQGVRVGPDLISVAGRPPADLLVAILDPAREAAPDGLGSIVVTTQGQTLTGLLAEETPAAVRLRRAEGVEDVIPRAEIEAIRPTGRSLMPDGLEQQLKPQDMADLIAFLRSAP